jgi:hypothetical protein
MSNEKTQIDGKRFTQRERVTIEGGLLDYARCYGRENGKGGYVIGESFGERIASLQAVAVKFLKQQNLPHTPMVYKVANAPKEWVESDDPEDVEHAIQKYELSCKLHGDDIGRPPISGLKLKEGIEARWEMDEPPKERNLGSALLDNHISNLGYKRDSFEDLAARIITEIFLLQQRPTEQKPEIAFNLGQLAMTARVYSLESLVNEKNAKQSKKQQWAIDLAGDLKNKGYIKFPDAWGAIPEDDDYSDDLSVKKTIKDGEEGVEYLDVNPPDFLTKESFRTGYFVKKSKKIK